MLLFRKIDETIWFGRNSLESLSVTELNTKNNELSVWMDDRKVMAIDLALAFALTQKTIKDMWFVKIPVDCLQDKKLVLRQQDSKTCFEAMRSFHTNIKVPTLFELGSLAEIIHDLVEKPDVNCMYFSETVLKHHFYNRVKQDCIHIDFSDKDNQQKRNILREMEKKLGKIDFTQLKNVKV